MVKLPSLIKSGKFNGVKARRHRFFNRSLQVWLEPTNGPSTNLFSKVVVVHCMVNILLYVINLHDRSTKLPFLYFSYYIKQCGDIIVVFSYYCYGPGNWYVTHGLK